MMDALGSVYNDVTIDSSCPEPFNFPIEANACGEFVVGSSESEQAEEGT